VSEKTVEENILRKSNQKRMLGELAIEGGNFTTAYFKKVWELLLNKYELIRKITEIL
jgi:hypothetical protein